MISKSMKVKAKYLQAMVNVDMMLDTIKNDTAWSWAESDRGPLETKRLAVEKGLSSFSRAFLVRDLKDLKTEMGKHTFLQGLQEFLKVDELVEPLTHAVEMIKRMQSARMRAS